MSKIDFIKQYEKNFEFSPKEIESLEKSGEDSARVQETYDLVVSYIKRFGRQKDILTKRHDAIEVRNNNSGLFKQICNYRAMGLKPAKIADILKISKKKYYSLVITYDYNLRK